MPKVAITVFVPAETVFLPILALTPLILIRSPVFEPVTEIVITRFTTTTLSAVVVTAGTEGLGVAVAEGVGEGVGVIAFSITVKVV